MLLDEVRPLNWSMLPPWPWDSVTFQVPLHSFLRFMSGRDGIWRGSGGDLFDSGARNLLNFAGGDLLNFACVFGGILFY